MTRPSQRREMAGRAVALRGVSIALACRTFVLSETCFRYSAKLNEENEQIADLPIGLTRAKKTWGFGLCFLYVRNVRGINGTIGTQRLGRPVPRQQLLKPADRRVGNVGENVCKPGLWVDVIELGAHDQCRHECRTFSITIRSGKQP